MTIATYDVVISENGDPALPALVPGPYLCIEVSDNGCGMDEETRERIFEPFFTTKPEGKGTGFGLAGVLNFVKNRSGTVHVRSTVGVGTAVSLYLPTDEAAVCGPLTHADGKTDQGCILLIDDDAEVSKSMANMLEEFGYRVEHFDNGRGAVDRYRMNPTGVDLVILDWVMPELSGKDTFTALRAVNENIKVLLASARVSEDEVKSVLARGAAGYIEKPFSAKELAAKIDAALRPELQPN
jgi:CheY-like chemotaxis protein/anti-sigma regulatory factor (Ser/Thr protein kinase)